MNPILAKNYDAEGATPAYRLVKHGTAAGQVMLAAAATDRPIGVSHELDAADGERLDVNKIGIAEVEAGGVIARGDPVTSDASGKGVNAAPGVGTNNGIVGFAEDDAVAGDIFNVTLSLGSIQG